VLMIEARIFIKEGLLDLNSSNNPRYILLFQNLILLCKPQSTPGDVIFPILDHEDITSSSTVESLENLAFDFSPNTKKKFSLIAETAESKLEWIGALQEAVNSSSRVSNYDGTNRLLLSSGQVVRKNFTQLHL